MAGTFLMLIELHIGAVPAWLDSFPIYPLNYLEDEHAFSSYVSPYIFERVRCTAYNRYGLRVDLSHESVYTTLEKGSKGPEQWYEEVRVHRSNETDEEIEEICSCDDGACECSEFPPWTFCNNGTEYSFVYQCYDAYVPDLVERIVHQAQTMFGKKCKGVRKKTKAKAECFQYTFYDVMHGMHISKEEGTYLAMIVEHGLNRKPTWSDRFVAKVAPSSIKYTDIAVKLVKNKKKK